MEESGKLKAVQYNGSSCTDKAKRLI